MIRESKEPKINKVKNNNELASKIDNYDGVLMATGLLTGVALLESMTKSKTLTVMVVVILSLLVILLWFLS